MKEFSYHHQSIRGVSHWRAAYLHESTVIVFIFQGYRSPTTTLFGLVFLWSLTIPQRSSKNWDLIYLKRRFLYLQVFWHSPILNTSLSWLLYFSSPLLLTLTCNVSQDADSSSWTGSPVVETKHCCTLIIYSAQSKMLTFGLRTKTSPLRAIIWKCHMLLKNLSDLAYCHERMTFYRSRKLSYIF